MKTVYIVAGYGYNTKEAYATKEVAEKACEKIQLGLECGGYRTTVYVQELKIVEE